MFMKTYNRAKWDVLLLLLFSYLFIYCGRQNFGFAIVGMQQQLYLTTTDTGIIGAGMLFCYGLGQAINGSLADKYSARMLITIGLIFSFLLNFIASFAIGFWSIFIPWCLNGYAQSLGFASGGKIIINWWQQSERGKAFGLYLAASGFSSAIAFIISIFILQCFNWRYLFRLPVLTLLISAIVFYIFARDTPEELGYKEHPIIQHPNLTTKKRYKTTLKNLSFHIASITMGFSSIARYGLLLWVPAIYIYNNNEIISLALPFGMAIGCIITGYMSDIFFNNNRIVPTFIFLVAATICTFILYHLGDDQTYLKLILLFLTGLFIYGPQTLLFALCPEILGTAQAATGVGLMNAYAYAFSAIGEILIGYLIHITQNFNMAYYVVTCSCLLAAITTLLINTKFPSILIPASPLDFPYSDREDFDPD